MGSEGVGEMSGAVAPTVREGASNRSAIIGAMNLPDDELEAIRAYDEAKASNDEAVPFAIAIREIEDEPDDNN